MFRTAATVKTTAKSAISKNERDVNTIAATITATAIATIGIISRASVSEYAEVRPEYSQISFPSAHALTERTASLIPGSVSGPSNVTAKSAYGSL